MDDQPLSVELSKINFLLENLYAMTLKNHGAALSDIDDLADEMSRQAMLPPTIYGSAPAPTEIQAAQEMLAHRLAMFFAGVKDRHKQLP